MLVSMETSFEMTPLEKKKMGKLTGMNDYLIDS